MYNNPGGKIKALAKVVATIGILLSILSGMLAIGTAGRVSFNLGGSAGVITGGGAVYGIVIIVVGSLISWLSTLALYGFGELVENSALIRDELRRQPSSPGKPE